MVTLYQTLFLLPYCINPFHCHNNLMGQVPLLAPFIDEENKAGPEKLSDLPEVNTAGI